MFFLKRFKALRKAGILGLNERNGAYVMPYNQRRRYPLVDNKLLCKQRLGEHDIAVPRLLGRIATQHDAADLRHILHSMNEFAIKPAHGSGGSGILVAVGKRNHHWISPSGRLLSQEYIEHYVSNILGGMYSLGGQSDVAMIESLIHVHPCFEQYVQLGVPDIRIIVFRGYPVMAMTRLPTRHSDGKANLHLGAVGAGIDITSGRTCNAVLDNHPVNEHPDTGAALDNFQVPGWSHILLMAAQCSDAIGLGYIGADIVIDRDHGPLVLELNARPGLSIQIANHAGLRKRLETIRALPESAIPASERIARVHAFNAGDWQ